MKKIINNSNAEQLIKFIYIFILLFFVTGIAVNAQPTGPGGDVDAPLDGGLSLLIAGGVGYGVKKIREKRKMKC